MKYLPIISLLFLFSCITTDNTLDKYYNLVDLTDEARFYYKKLDTFQMIRKITSLDEVRNFKSVLKRGIVIESQREIVATHKIEIFSKGKLLGTFMVESSMNEPFVNFTSIILPFGFKLTYGLGMSI